MAVLITGVMRWLESMAAHEFDKRPQDLVNNRDSRLNDDREDQY